jgi:hypothetical protein
MKIAYTRLDNSYSLPDTTRMMKLNGEWALLYSDFSVSTAAVI